MWKGSAVVVFLIVLIAGPVAAHHNWAAIFDLEQRVTQVGVLTELDWRNPHIYLMVDVVNHAGRTESWSLQGPAPSFFRQQSFGRSDFEDSVGKSVTVEASRARDGSASGLIREVRLPNGVVVSACPENC